MRADATRFGEAVEAWGVAGMLLDFAYEGAEILSARGVASEIGLD